MNGNGRVISSKCGGSAAVPRHLGPVGGRPEPGTPLSGVELRRLGLLEESLEHCDEAARRFELRQVADPVEDLQAAAGDGLVGVLAMADGDDRVTLAALRDLLDQHEYHVEPVTAPPGLPARIPPYVLRTTGNTENEIKQAC